MKIAKVAKLKIAKVAPQVAKRVGQHLQTPEGKQQAKTFNEWAPELAKKHAAMVSQRTGLPGGDAAKLILDLLQSIASAVPALKVAKPVGKRNLPTAKPLPVAKRLPLANRISTGPTRPRNAAGKGSLPPRVGKAMLKKSLRYIYRILETN